MKQKNKNRSVSKAPFCINFKIKKPFLNLKYSKTLFNKANKNIKIMGKSQLDLLSLIVYLKFFN